MSIRGRSKSPRPIQDVDVDMENPKPTSQEKPEAKVVIVTNLTRNVDQSHLNIVFGVYGQITKIDLPIFGKCKGKHNPRDNILIHSTPFSRSKQRKSRLGIRRLAVSSQGRITHGWWPTRWRNSQS